MDSRCSILLLPSTSMELALSLESTFEFSIFVKILLRIFAGGQLRVKRDLDLFSCVVVRADKFLFRRRSAHNRRCLTARRSSFVFYPVFRCPLTVSAVKSYFL